MRRTHELAQAHTFTNPRSRALARTTHVIRFSIILYAIPSAVSCVSDIPGICVLWANCAQFQSCPTHQDPWHLRAHFVHSTIGLLYFGNLFGCLQHFWIRCEHFSCIPANPWVYSRSDITRATAPYQHSVLKNTICACERSRVCVRVWHRSIRGAHGTN